MDTLFEIRVFGIQYCGIWFANGSWEYGSWSGNISPDSIIFNLFVNDQLSLHLFQYFHTHLLKLRI